MKLKNDLVLRQVADTWAILPLNRDALNFNGMLTLNASGAMLWNVLQQTGDMTAMVDALTAAYEVDRQQAQADVEEFIEKLTEAGCLEN